MGAFVKASLICSLLLCFVSPALGQYFSPDEFAVQVVNGTVIVEHFNAVYNCCFEGVQHQVVVNGNVIDITEVEILYYPCFCLCEYSTAAFIEGLSGGDYSIAFHWFEDPDWDQVELSIHVPEGSGGRDKDFQVDSQWSECEGGSVATAKVTWSGLKALYR